MERFVCSFRDIPGFLGLILKDCLYSRSTQEAWPTEVVSKPGPEMILSVLNINKASFLGSFKVTVSHQVWLVRRSNHEMYRLFSWYNLTVGCTFK